MPAGCVQICEQRRPCPSLSASSLLLPHISACLLPPWPWNCLHLSRCQQGRPVLKGSKPALPEVSMHWCRSLSKSSSLYLARNTEHDAPYWRGPIWFNINFLTLRALHHYSSSRGPHAALAQGLHDELRRNLLRNLVSRGVAGAEPPATMAPVKGGLRHMAWWHLESCILQLAPIATIDACFVCPQTPRP